jgi:hypothetical protein
VTQQLQKSIDFRQIELYDFHLSSSTLFYFELADLGTGVAQLTRLKLIPG